MTSSAERTARAGGHTSVAADFQSGQHRPRHSLTPEELDREYRAALRREVQVRKEKQDLEEVLLRTKGKFLMIISAIDFELQRLARESDRHVVANDVATVKVDR